jgi:diguanylate cyclase
MHFDSWSVEIPIPVALGFVATLGYMISRWRRLAANDTAIHTRRELKRAQAVATELEKITWSVRRSLAQHHASVAKFRDRVGRLSDRQQEAAWRDLCQEADKILKPTLQLATQLATAYDEVRQQSANLMTFTEVRTDPLTGVSNRRGFDDAISTQIALMSRYHSPFSLAMFDIDHFKQVNDRDGHLQGDQVLQELARLFEECARETDLIARYGGEEFVVVMPQTDMAGACMLSERLRHDVAGRLTITISGGVATAVDGDTAESLFARADAALYSAKIAGRNRVFCHLGGDDIHPVAVETAAESEVLVEAVSP